MVLVVLGLGWLSSRYYLLEIRGRLRRRRWRLELLVLRWRLILGCSILLQLLKEGRILLLRVMREIVIQRLPRIAILPIEVVRHLRVAGARQERVTNRACLLLSFNFESYSSPICFNLHDFDFYSRASPFRLCVPGKSPLRRACLNCELGLLEVSRTTLILLSP